MTSHTPSSVRGTQITRPHERIAVLSLSIKALAPNTPHDDMLRTTYASMMLRGAGSLTREKIQDTLGNLGSTIDVSAHDGIITVSVHTLDTALAGTLKLLRTILTQPTFSDAELTRTKEYLTNLLVLAKEDAKSASYRQFLGKILHKADRRAEYTIDTCIAEVAKITAKELHAFHTSLWNYEWVYTTGGSPQSCTEMESLVVRIHGTHTNIDASYVPPALSVIPKRIVTLSDIPHKQNIEVNIGSTLPMYRTDSLYPAFMFGMSVLGMQGGFTGRLMSTVREKEGLTYGIYGRAEGVGMHEQGYWRIFTFFAPKDVVKGITSTLREIQAIHEHGITDNELKRFKAILNTRYALIEDSLFKKVQDAHARAVAGVSDAMYTEFRNALQAMRPSDVHEAMQTYLRPDTLVISGSGPIHGVKNNIQAFGV